MLYNKVDNKSALSEGFVDFGAIEKKHFELEKGAILQIIHLSSTTSPIFIVLPHFEIIFKRNGRVPIHTISMKKCSYSSYCLFFGEGVNYFL